MEAEEEEEECYSLVLKSIVNCSSTLLARYIRKAAGCEFPRGLDYSGAFFQSPRFYSFSKNARTSGWENFPTLFYSLQAEIEAHW